MADDIDALLRAADQGKAVGTTQRYFRGAPPQPAPAPKPGGPAKPPANETDDEFIARMLGKGKTSSISDVGEGVTPGQMTAQASGAIPAGFRPVTLPPTFYEVPAPETGAKPDVVMSADPAMATQQTLLASGQPQELNRVQQIGNVVLPTLAQTPLIGGAGAAAQAARLPAVVGRLAGATGLSAGKQLARGDSPLGWETVIDAAVAGGTEALFGAARHLPKVGLQQLGAASRGFEWATAAPAQALDFVRDRIKGTTRMVIPSIDPAKKLTWEEAIGALKKMTGEPYRVARAEIANWMTMADKQALRPRAGQIFKDMTARSRFPASQFSELAEATNQAARSTVARSVAHAEGQHDIPTGRESIPAIPAAIPAAGVARELGSPVVRALRGLVP